MYIDRLTITALVIFLVALAGFIRFCMVAVCGMRPGDSQAPTEPQAGEGKS